MDFDEYVATSRPALFRFAVVLTGNPTVADDVVSEVLATAFQRWLQVSAADHVHAYVRRMVVNEYLGQRRRSARLRYTAEVADLLPPEPDHAKAHAEQRRLVDELRKLPPRQRAAVVLRYYEGQSFREIAVALGTGENAVRSNISRALRRLRVQLTEDDDSVHRTRPASLEVTTR